MYKSKYKGIFTPKFPNKYVGKSDIVFRSLWELSCMKYFDENSNIISWSSEEIIVPYVSPVDGRPHRYYPDFLIKIRDTNDKEEIILIEVKPFAQTQPPKKPNRQTKRYLTECNTFAVNMAKFEAARDFCQRNGWKFDIITEHDLKL